MAYKEDVRIIAGYLKGEARALAEVDGWINLVARNAKWNFGDELEDIAQDIRLTVLENFQNDKFRFRSSLKTYVLRIAKYTCIDHLRCRRKLLSIDDGGVEIASCQKGPEEELHEKEQRDIFMKIFQSLPRRCQDLWRMVFEEKLPYAQIAKRLIISEGTVKSRFARCKEKAIELRYEFSRNFGVGDSTISL